MSTDPLALVRDRLIELTSSWQSAPDLAYIRDSFAAYLQEVGPKGAAWAQPREQLIAPGLEGAWIGQSERRALYCHGGGFQMGGVASHASLIARLAQAGNVQILAFDYRLAPEHRYPAASDDALRAYQWLVAQGGPPVAVIGDSAGGALALRTVQQARDAGLALPSQIILISPWLDLSMQSDSYTCLAEHDIFSRPEQLRRMARTYVGRGGPALDSPLVSPLWGDLSALPPIIVSAGAADITVGDSWKLVERVLAAEGKIELHVVPDMCHHFQIYEALPQAQESLEELGRYLCHSS